MIKLIGIAIVAIGFALRVNTLLVVVLAGIVTGLVSGLSFHDIVSQFGTAFVENRYMTLPVVLMLPLVGMLERHGLRERAEMLIRRTRAATAGRVLLVYSAARQLSISLGVRIGDHASAVRPLVAPMAEAAAMKQVAAMAAQSAHNVGGVPSPRCSIGSAIPRDGGTPPTNAAEIQGRADATPPTAGDGELPRDVVHLIRANAAAAENVGNFFGEDVFVAVGAVLLMNGFFQGLGMQVSILSLALWGIPTALVAFGVMVWRVRVLDRAIERRLKPALKGTP